MVRSTWGRLALVAVIVAAATTSGAGAHATSATAAPVVVAGCADAPAHLAATRSQRLEGAKAARHLQWIDLSKVVPRLAPGPDWTSEYLGGPVHDITTLPAGTVSEARTVLVPNGLEQGFVRGFRTDPSGDRVFYAAYRFATTAGAADTADAVITRACERKRDFLSSADGVVGAADDTPPSAEVDLVMVTNRLLLDFYADGPSLDVARAEQLASDFFAAAGAVERGPTDPRSVGRATTAQACSRLAFATNLPGLSGLTIGEIRTAAREELAAVRHASADPDARRVERTLRALVHRLGRRYDATEAAAALDNACRRLTGTGAFRA